MEDSTEEKLFAIKSKFLREIPHPKLILKAITQTRQLSGDSSDKALPAPGEITAGPLRDSLKNYGARLLDLKLAISQSNDPGVLSDHLVQLYVEHTALLKKLASYLPALPVYPDQFIKLSEPVDSYVLAQFIDSARIPENEIKLYICNSIGDGSLHDFDVLTKACLGSRKICVNEGSV